MFFFSNFRALFCLAAMIFVAFTIESSAQGTPTANITGRAADASGAVVPSVRVTATNTATNLVRETVTNEGGDYTLTNLPVGTYTIAAEGANFKRFVTESVVLQVNESREINFALEAGNVQETVTVTAETAQVDTTTGTLKEVVDSARIVGLPLNGRNALQLQQLVPGAARIVAAGQGQNETISINGSRPNSNNYRLDGGDNHDPFFNSPSVFPNPDALQEFSILTSSYSAAYGRNAGATINAVTRSGTNDFHGSLFEFIRNERFNARSYFAAKAPPFKRNQFGGSIGGPLPFLNFGEGGPVFNSGKDRLFFFFAYQGWRERSSPNVLSAIVPTAAQRGGNFAGSATIRDPVNNQPFANNVIPTARLNQAALNFLNAFVPLPNGANGLLTSPNGGRFDQNQYVARIDYQLFRSDTITGRLLYNKDSTFETAGNIPNISNFTNYKNVNLTLSDTHVFNPTLVNSVRITFNKIDRAQTPSVPGNKTWTDFGAGFVRATAAEIPASISTTVTGYFNALSRFPLTQFRNYYQILDDANYTLGAHQLGFGGTFSRAHLDRQEYFRSDPHLVFRGNFSGNALADFFLGRASQVIQTSVNQTNTNTDEFALYALDDWKTTKKLTLNLGLRWEPFFPTTDEFNRFAQFRPGVQSTVFPFAPVGLVFPGDAGVPDSTTKKRYANFAPRFGFAYDVFGDGKTALRGGYGVFYSQIRQQSDNQQGSNQPYSLRLVINNPAGGVNAPYGAAGSPYPFTAPTENQAAAFRFVTPITLTTYDPDFRNAVVQQWNLNIQREVFKGYIFTASYVGNKGDHLYVQRQVNPARPGTAALDARRIYAPFFGQVTGYASVGKSIYHSGQFGVNKRFAQGFSLLASYTFSKLIDTTSSDMDEPANPLDLQSNRALSDLDIPHRFVASFVFDLPKFKNVSKLAGVFLNGWEINGIVSVQSGTPFSILSGVDNSQSGVNFDRADIIGDPFAVTDDSRAGRIRQFFNTAAFRANAVGTFGNGGRNILRTAGYSNADIGVFKDFPGFFENNKIQFRAEIFNLFNHVNLDQPDNNFSSASFGRITNTRGDPRVLQFALKYLF